MKRGQVPMTARRRRACFVLVGAAFSIFGATAMPANAEGGSSAEVDPQTKLDFSLQDDAGFVPAGEPGTGNSAATWHDQQGRTKVVLQGSNANALMSTVQSHGGRVIAHAPGEVSAFVPAGELADLADETAVGAIREPFALEPMDVTSEGVVNTGADVWHTEGNTADGVKIAVVDVGFAGYTALYGTDLPPDELVFEQSYCANGMKGGPPASTGISHGTAVAEIIHDMAPGAELHLICTDDQTGFASAGQYLIDNGIKIANASIGNNIAGRGDGSGADNTFAGVVRRTRMAGVLWSISAGNNGGRHFNFAADKKTTTRNSLYYFPGDTTFDITVAATDVDGDGLAGRAFVEAKWDAWPTTDVNLDFFVYPTINAFLIGPSAAIGGSTLVQDGNDPPIELVNDGLLPGWKNTSGATQTHYLETRLTGGPMPTGLRVDFFLSGDILGVQAATPSDLSEPATSPYAMAVGAYNVASGQLEPFSSRGPTIDGAVKPEIAAPDGVHTATTATGLFYGTSGAAPHVTGAAALLLKQNPDLDVAELEQQLMDLASDVAPAGLDSNTGAGQLRLGAFTTPEPPQGSLFQPLSAPVRLLDTREASCVGPKCTPFDEDEQLALTITGQYGVPANATAAVMNVTVAGASEPGFITVWPTGAAQPNASNLNFSAGQVVPNSVTSAIGTDGDVSFFNSDGTTDLVVDLMGYYTPDTGAGLVPLNPPVRAVDTRPAFCVGTRCSALGPDESLPVLLASRTIGDVTIPDEATAVVLNVTVTEPTSGGFFTVYPDGVARPSTSSLNFSPGVTVPNLVVVGIGANNRVQFYNSVGNTHVIVDVVGYYVPDAGSRYVAVSPTRALDTRSGTGLRHTPLPNDTAFDLQVGYLYGVPTDATAVLANATVVTPTAPGFLAVYPSGVPFPGTSNLNYTSGMTVPNAIVSAIGTSGRVTLWADDGAPHALFDIQGYFIQPPAT